MSKAIWLCARCARKKDVQTEEDPVVLKACSECNVENWVRPYGHAGADAVDNETMPEPKIVIAKGDAEIETTVEDLEILTATAKEIEDDRAEKARLAKIEKYKAKLAELEG